MTYRLTNFDPVAFLQEYWQKRPGVFKGVFTDFVDPLDEHELAGLAMEEEIDSRIVSCNGNDWQVSEGPFSDFDAFCQHYWTLLVQSVDHYDQQGDALISAFNFIPYWRTDNLMVSFSVKGAGVGAHIDQYDVFIVQGKGSRRWQIGNPGDYEPHFPHPALSQIRAFDAVIDEILQPGDMIYIPPGHPHRGETLSDCMNYSVGLRGPTQQQLLDAFAAGALEHDWFVRRLSDPERQHQQRPDEIIQQDIQKFRQYFHEMIDSDQFLLWLGQYSAQRNIEPLPTSDVNQNSTQKPQFDAPITLCRQAGIRAVFISADAFQDRTARAFVEGLEFAIPDAECELVRNFLNSTIFKFDPKINHKSSLFFNQIVIKLIDSGYWYQKR